MQLGNGRKVFCCYNNQYQTLFLSSSIIQLSWKKDDGKQALKATFYLHIHHKFNYN